VVKGKASLLLMWWEVRTGHPRFIFFLRHSFRSLGFLSLIFLLGFLMNCASRGEWSQLRVGLWAAEHDLWDEAIFRWQKALEKMPNSAVVHNNLAVAYEKKGLWEKARQEYELALKLAPEHQYIKANYRNFQENLKAAEKPEKTPEEKKAEKKEGRPPHAADRGPITLLNEPERPAYPDYLLRNH